ncbi:MAG: OB-fold domain-containing protein [candidate division NC10 bacterium]|nr:OB-fold domain-containing protein [candidate division NC10 bacterium]
MAEGPETQGEEGAPADTIPASRCPCGTVTAPPTPHCPACGGSMEPDTLPAVGEILSYTILHSPPTGFAAPLPIALVELAGGVRFLCHGHGEQAGRYRIGRQVAIEEVDGIYYAATLTLRERIGLIWRRRGEAEAKLRSIFRTALQHLRRRP